MLHRIAQIAENRQLPVTMMETFALIPANMDKFGIVNDYGYPEIDTWHCNEFVEAFRAYLNEMNGENVELCMNQANDGSAFQ